MDRMSALDAGFFFAESENTPMHVGSVAVFDGPAPSYGDVVRLLLSKLPLVPRYRQRVRRGADAARPAAVGRRPALPDPVPRAAHRGARARAATSSCATWPAACSASASTWPSRCGSCGWSRAWPTNRWAIISKVHHCMVDGVAGTDLMQLMFDLEPDATHEAPKDWTPRRSPVEPVAGRRAPSPTRSTHPLQQLRVAAQRSAARCAAAKALADRARPSPRPCPRWPSRRSRPTARSLNGPIGPHRRWAWTDGQVRGVQGRPDGVRRHGQRRRPHRDHRRLPRPAAGPRRAVLGEARRPLDGAGVGAQGRPEGLR